jgi:hypothetical protein
LYVQFNNGPDRLAEQTAAADRFQRRLSGGVRLHETGIPTTQ